MPRRVTEWSIGTQIVAAATAALVPWAALALAGAAPSHHLFLFIAAGLLSGACLFAIVRLLAPLGPLAATLRSLAPAGEAPEAAKGTLAGLLADAARLVERVKALEHRWVQRHALTTLPIRESLLAAMAEDIASRPETPVLAGAIRFSDYKRLGAFDPAAAETALKLFAERLAASLGKARPLAHVDRDCFAVWFRGVDAAAAKSELAALSYALNAEIEAGQLKLAPEIEVGVALYPEDSAEPAALLNHALVSLVRTGADGGPVAEAGGAGAARERFTLEQDLRRAIERHQLELHYQPVVDLDKGALIGAEALLRWRHPEVGMIMPDRFIPILEDADLTDRIGLWTLNAACREAHDWRAQGLGPLKVAVNLSARQLRDRELVRKIGRTLSLHKLEPHALELELTETAATEDAERTHFLFGELRRLGVSLAIDDFGSGYSSLSYLKNLPFDRLKIDREFVVDVHLRPDSQAICRSLIALTRGLGLQILAEGVESAEEIEMLRGLGCTIFQGFFFSRPLTANDFVRYAFEASKEGHFGIESLRDSGDKRLRA